MEQNYPCDHQNLLGKLMEEGALNPRLLDRLLGAYTIFESGGRKCFRKQASTLYLEIMYREESTAKSFEDRDFWRLYSMKTGKESVRRLRTERLPGLAAVFAVS